MMKTRATRALSRRKRAVDLRDARRLSRESLALAAALFEMMWFEQERLEVRLRALARRVARLESDWMSATRDSVTRRHLGGGTAKPGPRGHQPEPAGDGHRPAHASTRSLHLLPVPPGTT